MGLLRPFATGEDALLMQRSILGRSRACTLRLTEPVVSGEHASLCWVREAWELQDLHSRNGTFVDGRRLARGERAILAPGAVIGLGQARSFMLVEAGPPEAFAAPLGGGPPVVVVGGILALPDPATPQVMIVGGPRGWTIERAGEALALAVDDGEVVRIGTDAWQLHLPELLQQTLDSWTSPLSLDSVTLRFRVSSDEESVELLVVHGARTIDLKARSHHYTLLVLARARLRDRALPDERQGWVLQSDLLRMLRIDANHLHLDIYRLRCQLGEAGFADAARVIERRVGIRALRIGVARLEIGGLDLNPLDGEPAGS